MMKIDTLEEFPVPAVHARVRGKRTRRQRSAAAAAESRNSFFYSSSDTSSGISTRTEEDEDMANCLILLAHGDSPPPPPLPEDKLSGRISTEMATTRAGSVGVYIYECKTCNRTFPSFQALGGHRASHKKPRPSSADDQKKALRPPGAVDQQGGDEKLLGKLSSNKICPTNDQIRPKIHECSICGSEFASGQALGGHMRRHRAAPAIAMDNGILTDVATEKPRSEVVLDLDLNLPAPPEDDKFNQFPGDQQQPMVFSAAALVDCHY